MRPAPLPPRLVGLRSTERTGVDPVRSSGVRGRERWWLLVALGVLLLAVVAVYGPSMNVVPWVLVIVIASAAAVLVLRSILRAAQEPDTLAAGKLAGERSGELLAFGAVLGRARSGYRYSQAIASARVASAFLEKVRLTRGLSPLEIEQVRTDRGVLLDLIGEPELADFVYEHHRESRELPKAGSTVAAGKRFGAAFSRVLEAMEAWS